jgi:hypothetical protein
VKITTTSIQNQKHIVNADSFPNTRPKIIAIRKSTNPNQNVTKIIYEIFNNTSIGLEYLYEDFENDDELDEVVTITTQLAVEF